MFGIKQVGRGAASVYLENSLGAYRDAFMALSEPIAVGHKQQDTSSRAIAVLPNHRVQYLKDC